MSVTSVGTPTAATGTASPVTATYGTGQNRSPGNLLVAVVAWTGTTSTTATAQNAGTTGWMNVVEIATTATLARVSIWVKRASGSDAAPAFTSTLTGTATSACTIYELNSTSGVINASGTVTANAATVTAQSAVTSSNVLETGDFGIAMFARERSSTASAVTASGTYTLDTSNSGTSSTGHFGSMSLANPATGATSTATINYSLSGTSSDAAGAVVIFGSSGPIFRQAVQPSSVVQARIPPGNLNQARYGGINEGLLPTVPRSGNSSGSAGGFSLGRISSSFGASVSNPPVAVGPPLATNNPVGVRAIYLRTGSCLVGNPGAPVQNQQPGPPYNTRLVRRVAVIPFRSGVW